MSSFIGDPDQQKVIALDGGYHLVLAPPGCGKTTILAERIIRAHAVGKDYRDMICLTFTNRASREMRERIASRSGNPVSGDLFVGNVHRFCSQFLFDNKLIPQNTAVIDDVDTESIIADIAHLSYQDNPYRFAQRIVRMQHAIHQLRHGFPERLIVDLDMVRNDASNSLVKVLQTSDHFKFASDEALRQIYARPREFAEFVRECHDFKPWERSAIEQLLYDAYVANCYEEYKEADNLIDFEDLLEKTYEYVSDDSNDFHRYDWIQVDEVQDLNFLQLAIVDCITAQDLPTVVYLGDEQQAIFSFAGAQLATLQHLKQRCAGNLHHLCHNHRSPRYLLDFFNAFATKQLHIDPQLLPTTDDDQSPQPEDLCLFGACYLDLTPMFDKTMRRCPFDRLHCLECGRPVRGEYALAVKLALRYGSKPDKGRVAVIVPSNRDADLISKEFEKMQVPHFKVSGEDSFASPEMQLLISHFNVVESETCFIAWAKLLYRLQVVLDYSQARNLMREMRRCAITPTDFLRNENRTYLQEFTQRYANETIVLFDTETTGLDVFEDDIIQIAAIKICNGVLVEGSEFEVILETHRELPVEVGGHPNPMLKVYNQGPRLERKEGLRRFLDYCQGHTLVGHNVEYDYHILRYNLQRELPDVVLDVLCPVHLDTLKYIRLVEPRLRVYKLERLLETLHLEGCNSHNAIDDVKATKSLLDYCHQCALKLLPKQEEFLQRDATHAWVTDFRSKYLPIYSHTVQRLYCRNSPDDDVPLFVDELQRVYDLLLREGLIKSVPKWNHVVDYLTYDLVRHQEHPSLLQQLSRYVVEFTTCREADLCGSDTISEQYFVSTVHKAKGLEFDNVILFDAVEGRYPFYANVQEHNQEGMLEDARKFYVAISRAKKRLCITYSHVNTRCRTTEVSPFLSGLQDHYTHYAFNPHTGKMETAL